MSDKIFIGTNAAGAGHAPALEPISGIALVVDEEHEYRAGSDSGRVLEVQCPYGSQAMADALLGQLRGYAYQPMSAQDALLDPAAELGDGVTVDGVYTVLAQADTTFDALCAADIAAPGEEELESEYQYTSQSQGETDRELAQLKSTIAKTSTEINLRVDGLEEQYTSLSVKVDGVTITDGSGTTLIRGNMIQTETLYVDAAHINGKLTAEQIELDLTGSITWNDLSRRVQREITTAQEDAEAAQEEAEAAATDAAAAEKAAADAKTTVSGWTYTGTTYIDGSKIQAGTVSASTLEGGAIALLDSRGRTAGTMVISGASSAEYAVQLQSGGAMRLTAGGSGAAIWLEAGDAGFGLGTSGSLGYLVQCGGSIIPTSNNSYNCGMASYKWSAVYATNGTIQTSDANAKTDIEALPDKYLDLFDRLEPRRYRMRSGSSGRYHVGYIAQEVKAAMDDCGITDGEFAGWVRDRDKDGQEIFMLRYDEFDAIRDAKIRRLEERIRRLEEGK